MNHWQMLLPGTHHVRSQQSLTLEIAATYTQSLPPKRLTARVVAVGPIVIEVVVIVDGVTVTTSGTEVVIVVATVLVVVTTRDEQLIHSMSG